MRRSLVGRIVVAAVVVTLAAVLGTVWLTENTRASFSIAQHEVDWSSDAVILESLLEWGGTHPGWDGVEQLASRLSREHGRRIAVLQGDEVVADTLPGLPMPQHAVHRLDLWDDASQVPPDDAGVPATDVVEMPRYVAGAFLLTTAEKASLGTGAAGAARCARLDPAHELDYLPSGRPVLNLSRDTELCGSPELAAPLAQERDALAELTGLTNACLLGTGEQGVDAISLVTFPTEGTGRLAFQVLDPEGEPAAVPAAVRRCLQKAFAEQSEGLVAPPATVYLTDLRGDVRGPLDLSPGSVARIAAVSGALLLLVLATAWFVGAPVVRQVRAVTEASRRLAQGEPDVQVPVGGTGEVSELARSFNAMSADLVRSREQQRRMVSDVAHEVRTPLTTLRGWLEGAQDGVVPVDHDLVDLLHGETMHLQSIADDLLTLTLAESGSLELHRGAVDVTGLLEDAARRATAGAASAGMVVRTRVEEGLVVRGDTRRLRQVVDNLVANALMHSGGTVVEVRGRPSDGRVVVEVEDDGAGLDPQDVGHLFDRFWRADRSRARGTGGSGLGLAVVRELVELHGGTVSASSSPCQGARIVVVLPRGTDHDAD